MQDPHGRRPFLLAKGRGSNVYFRQAKALIVHALVEETMSDELSDPGQEYEKTRKNIETLERLLALTAEPKRRAYIDSQLVKLRRFRDRLAASFDLGADAGDATAAEKRPKSERALPFLARIGSRFEDDGVVKASKDPEIRNLAIYLLFFEQEYLPLFDKKRLDLDHMSSLELDSFYNTFNQVKRRMEIFCNETEAIYDEKEAPRLLQRLKAKQILLVEVHKFFKRIRTFTSEMNEDIEGERRRCFNGDATLSLNSAAQKLELTGITVEVALARISHYAGEVIGYLDIPDFQR